MEIGINLMTNNNSENHYRNQPVSFFNKNKKHLTFRTFKWISIVVFGIYLYFDEALLQQVKDVLWTIVY